MKVKVGEREIEVKPLMAYDARRIQLRLGLRLQNLKDENKKVDAGLEAWFDKLSLASGLPVDELKNMTENDVSIIEDAFKRLSEVSNEEVKNL